MHTMFRPIKRPMNIQKPQTIIGQLAVGHTLNIPPICNAYGNNRPMMSLHVRLVWSLKFVKFFRFSGTVSLPKMSEGRILDLDSDKGRFSCLNA